MQQLALLDPLCSSDGTVAVNEEATKWPDALRLRGGGDSKGIVG